LLNGFASIAGACLRTGRSPRMVLFGSGAGLIEIPPRLVHFRQAIGLTFRAQFATNRRVFVCYAPPLKRAHRRCGPCRCTFAFRSEDAGEVMKDLLTKTHDAALRAGKYWGNAGAQFLTGNRLSADTRFVQNGPARDCWIPPARGRGRSALEEPTLGVAAGTPPTVAPPCVVK
jgi:hypothetical protein